MGLSYHRGKSRLITYHEEVLSSQLGGGTMYHVTRAADVSSLFMLGKYMPPNVNNRFSSHIKLSYTPMPEESSNLSISGCHSKPLIFAY